LDHLHYFLGFEVTYLPEGISLSQQKFTQDLLKDTAFVSFKSVATPLPLHCKLTVDDGDLFHGLSCYIGQSLAN